MHCASPPSAAANPAWRSSRARASNRPA